MAHRLSNVDRGARKAARRPLRRLARVTRRPSLRRDLYELASLTSRQA